jgi:RNA polymerase sigma-70 factor (ECF subfamily)
MATARAASGGRRHNLTLQKVAPARGRREQKSADAAFESFYRKHVADVYQYALAVLANAADAEDVTQQTFLNAYRAFERGERPHTPHNWLIKIAHNVCRMRWRQSSRRPQEVPLEQASEPAAPDEERSSLDAVLCALARLPFNQRAAIVMREAEDRSYAEIAEVLGTTVPAVEALLFRARTNLRARREALGVLSVAPLPGSLSSFIGGGGSGFLAAGGVAVGSELVLKAAAVVATGVVAGGLGFKMVQAVATSAPPPSRQYQAPLVWTSPVDRLVSRSAAPERRQRPHVASFGHPRRLTAGAGRAHKAPMHDDAAAAGAVGADEPGASSDGGGIAAGGGAAASEGGAASPAGAAPAAGPSAPATSPATSVNTVVGALPPVPKPATPTLPPPPVQLPPPPPVSVSPPTVSVPTVSVPTVTLPSPPSPLK